MVGAPFSRAAHNDDAQDTERGVSGSAGGGPVRQVARVVFLPALLAAQGAGAEVMVEGITLLVLLLCAPCQCLALALQPGLLRAGVDSATSACVAPAVIFQVSLSLLIDQRPVEVLVQLPLLIKYCCMDGFPRC